MLEAVRSHFILSQYIGRKHRVIKKNNHCVALCPFHREKTPSFHINDVKGVYHCFGCGRSGNIINYLMESENLPFKEALHILSREAGISARPTESEQREQEALAPVKRACLEAALWYQSQLAHTHTAYLEERGISKETQNCFQVGFAPGKGLLPFLKSKGVHHTHAQQAGLIMEIDGRLVERFRQRIMFPIYNTKGEFIAFGGRLIHKGEPKYLNSPETALFKKNQVLYGLHHNVSAALRQPHIVVEGYLDVMAMHQAGLNTTVATLGTALSEHHLDFLWRRSDHFFVCMDGDNAGRRASERIAHMVLPFITPKRRLRFVALPNGDDPASLLKDTSSENMRELIQQAVPLHEQLWQTCHIHRITKHSTPEVRSQFQEAFCELCHSIVHKGLRSFYIREFQQRFYQHLRHMHTQARRPSTLKPRPVCVPMRHGEALLITLLVLQDTLFGHVQEHIVALPFKFYGHWVESIVDWFHRGSTTPAIPLKDWLVDKGHPVDDLLLAMERYIPGREVQWVEFWIEVWYNTIHKSQMRSETDASLKAFKMSPSTGRWTQLVAIKQSQERSRS